MAAAGKRKRVVDSDPDDDSTSEDHIPFSQRKFGVPSRSFGRDDSNHSDLEAESTVKVDGPEVESGHRKQNQGDGVFPGFRPFPRPNDLPPGNNGGPERADFRQEVEDLSSVGGVGGANDENGSDEGGSGNAGNQGSSSEESDSENDDPMTSDICAICDDGGKLLLCDGPCMRAFHGTRNSLADDQFNCPTLRLRPEDVEGVEHWLCPNCTYKAYQCFVCGELGKSTGDDKEVFACDVGDCGRFYHLSCLATWKKKEPGSEERDLDAYICSVKEGKGDFLCPAHRCRRCKKGEINGGRGNSSRLAKCRRCPKAWHKGCLPEKIRFKKHLDGPIRAWEIGNKTLLIYCLGHKIVERLSTPRRDHLKWPKEYRPVQRPEKSFAPGIVKRKRRIEDDDEEDDCSIGLKHTKRPKVVEEQKVLQKDSNATIRSSLAKPSSSLDLGASDRNRRPPISGLNRSAVPTKSASPPIRNDIKRKDVVARDTPGDIYFSKERQKMRIDQIVQQVKQSITEETVKKNLLHASCYSEGNAKHDEMRTGRLELGIIAAGKASDMVKKGGSHEEAREIFSRAQFIKVLKYSDYMRAYLAPLLIGHRYSSFGRHFTLKEKLIEIVERIHPYIDEGDMVVDMCCGSNEFSVFLNQKLLSVGKPCHFRNFDLHHTRNRFCFTRKDWMKNRGEDFLEGRKLIIGLNPPFGVQGALATQFIMHALSFRPKLLVLIVPPETMRSSEAYKDHGYELVWEDKDLLQGHAFYLPGSVDDNSKENLKQWNIVTPPLFLWSTREMIAKHKEIAFRCQHVEALPADARREVPNLVPNAASSSLVDFISRSQSQSLLNRPTRGPGVGPSTGPGNGHTSLSRHQGPHLANPSHQRYNAGPMPPGTEVSADALLFRSDLNYAESRGIGRMTMPQPNLPPNLGGPRPSQSPLEGMQTPYGVAPPLPDLGTPWEREYEGGRFRNRDPWAFSQQHMGWNSSTQHRPPPPNIPWQDTQFRGVGSEGRPGTRQDNADSGTGGWLD